MVCCSAKGCNNRSEQRVRMYGFPADTERRNRWLAQVSRNNFKITNNYNNYKLCEVHFEEDQFCLNRKGRTRLRSDAIPTIFAHLPVVKKKKKPPAQLYTQHPVNLARIRSEHSYSAKKDTGIKPPAPDQKKMDFFSLLQMHAIDVIEIDFSQQRQRDAERPATSSEEKDGDGGIRDQTVSEPGQSGSKPSQSEPPPEEPMSLDSPPPSQSEPPPEEPMSPDSLTPPSPVVTPPSPAVSPCQSPDRETQPDSNMSMEMRVAPPGLEAEYEDLVTPSSMMFLQELVSTFDQEVDQVLTLRVSRKAHLDMTGDLPEFSEVRPSVRGDPGWRVGPVPPRLSRRHVDVGDLAPCDTKRLLQALQSPAQGLQIDFDDGNCPTYHNQIKGLHNVYKVVNGLFPEAPPIKRAPVLMLRPRAWNMVEHNMMVNGKEVPGPLFDFGLLMFHCGKKLFDQQSGPFFYLSKVESYHEARLWNNIFVWTQDKLGLPQGSIKATVLIENVLAAFEMEEILFELKEHSAGLNCGIWDYSASFVNKFGQRSSFVLPDRSKYVNMQKRFLRSYMDLLVQTCHRRGALATGGMAATLLPTETDSATYRTLMDTVTRLKLLEIKAGVDGFMVYDLNLIEPMQKLFQTHTRGENQLDQRREDVRVTAKDLLTMPSGGVTLHGLQYNITVGILFIDAWLSGKGHFFYRGQVEDSATAEISRSQVWQWIRHRTRLEDDNRTVTRALVTDLTVEVINNLLEVTHKHSVRAVQRLTTAANMFLEVVQRRDFPEFLTTYLNLDHTFLSSQAQPQTVPTQPPPPYRPRTDPTPPQPETVPPPNPTQEVPTPPQPKTAPPPKLTTQPNPTQKDPAKPQNTHLPTLIPRPKTPKPASKL